MFLIDGEKLITRLRGENRRIFALADEARDKGYEREYREFAQRATGLSDAIQMVYDSLEYRMDDEPDHDVMYDLSKVLYHLGKDYEFRGLKLTPILSLQVSEDGYRASTIARLSDIYRNKDNLNYYIRRTVGKAEDTLKEALKEGPSEPSE